MARKKVYVPDITSEERAALSPEDGTLVRSNVSERDLQELRAKVGDDVWKVVRYDSPEVAAARMQKLLALSETSSTNSQADATSDYPEVELVFDDISSSCAFTADQVSDAAAKELELLGRSHPDTSFDFDTALMNILETIDSIVGTRKSGDTILSVNEIQAIGKRIGKVREQVVYGGSGKKGAKKNKQRV